MSTEIPPSVRGPYVREADRPSQSGPGRIAAIRLVFDGQNNPADRPQTTIPLDGVREKLSTDITALDAVEFKITPGESQQEHFFIGYTDDRNHKRARQKALGAGRDLNGWAETADAVPTTTGRAPATIAEKMRRIIEENTPASIKAQIVDLDLTPLGLLPRPTSRLLLTENVSFTRIDVSQRSAMYELVTTLNDRGVPYDCSTITTHVADGKSYDYLGTSRLVVFGTGNGIIREADIETFAETVDPDFRLSSYFDNKDIIDNFDLPVESHRRNARDAAYAQPIELLGEMSGRKTTARELKSGLSEYHALLNARMNPDSRYRELFNCYGVFRMDKRDLLHFHVAIPEFFEHSLWDGSATAAAHGITVHKLGDRAASTRQSYGTEHPDDPKRELENTHEESEPHQELVSEWVSYLLRNGHKILAIDQLDVDHNFEGTDPTQQTVFDDESRPDIVSKYNGQIYCHEIEIENDTKPSQLLTNLARGAHAGYPVVIVTASEKSARRKFENLNDATRMGPLPEPIKDADDKGVIEYNLDAVVTPEEGVTHILPDGVTEARWRHLPEDIRELLVNGTVVASGPAAASVDTYAYDLPRVRKHGSSYVLESSNGEVIREQPTKRAAIGDRTKVRKPFPLTHWHYLSNTTVHYQSGNEFIEYEYTPSWATRYRKSHAGRYEAAVKSFLEQVTVESPGDSISMTLLRSRFLEWYRAQTDLKEPSETWFGRAVNACSDSFEIDASDTRNKRLENRRLIFTEEVYSPDLAFIDGDEVDEE
ncbi:hypothetical protein [Halorubrum sp. LN27]|uniref:hypothetical protein n=1 Tax=Halorubrum sp. LN27 TaxID=2801032 RepID=UPI00190C8CA7|nr:hypothetical protein [Halorubrum sp. LN27]